MALNLMLVALVALASGAVALGAWQMRRGLPLDALPSLAWSALVIAPFLVQWVYWREPLAQTLGMLIFGAGVLLGDVLAARLTLRDADVSSATAAPAMADPRAVLAAVALALALLHLYLAPSIPGLWWLYVDEIDGAKLVALREASAKLLAVPWVVKHMFNWVLTVFSVIGIVALLAQRRYLLAGTWYALAFSYAVMTTAKAPVVLLTIGIAAGMAWPLSARARRRIYAIGLASLVALVTIGAIHIFASPSSRYNLLIREELRDTVAWE